MEEKENPINEYLLLRQQKNKLMEYDADNYNVEELRLVYKHCGTLYCYFSTRDKHPQRIESAKDECNHFWEIRETFRWKMEPQEYDRFINELSYIRLTLDL